MRAASTLSVLAFCALGCGAAGASANYTPPHPVRLPPGAPRPTAVGPCTEDASALHAGEPGLFVRNWMHRTFAVTLLEVEVDGAPMQSRSLDPGTSLEEVSLAGVRLPPGRHRLDVRVVLSTWNRYGISSLLSGSRFELRGAFALDVAADGRSRVVIYVVERGGVATPLEQRPSLQCRFNRG